MTPRSETKYAVLAARAAGVITQKRAGAEHVVVKGELDIATGTDLAAEDAIRAVLTAHCPNIPIIGEERGGELPAGSAPYFLVDPLCGTQTFATRIPAFCTNIALVEDGQVTASAVFDGATGEVYWAERGSGAFVERANGPERLAAKEGVILGFELAGAPVYTGRSEPLGALFASLVAEARWYPRLLGTTLPFARVATGDYSGLFLLGRVSAPLHTAAGCLLAEEAGALVTDPKGVPWDLGTVEFIVSSTKKLHGELLGLYAGAFGSTLRESTSDHT